MKFLSQKPFVNQSWVKSVGVAEKLQYFPQRCLQLAQKFRQVLYKIKFTGFDPWQFLQKVKATGFTPALDDYEKRKLSIFNQLNFFQLITGIIVPIVGLYHNQQIPAFAWVISCMPAFISVLVLWLNARYHHYLAQVAYFVLYPFITSVVYLSGMNLGVHLSFILYGILSVFFIQDISQMLFSIGLSMVSYFVLAVVCENYKYQLASVNIYFYYFNQLLAIGFIFYGLFLIKKENTGYQHSILQQKEEITENENLLKRQTEELTALNSLKNKLFSVISHDLKSPMYALRNLFRNMQQYDLPADEIKEMVPDVVNELTYTTSLMENLLLWTRSQMQADTVKPQMIDISSLMMEVFQLLQLQADAKKIKVLVKTDPAIFAFADPDMVNLVVRNLLSNAIKYTPERGSVTMSVSRILSGAEIFISDTGKGINPEAMEEINRQQFYSTKGTAGESGTGLGLMLCKEFLSRNGGKLHIESEQGKGSIFSFTLPAEE